MAVNKTLIIAEAGVNHNGDIDLAKKLIASAADADADYVKFQTFKADKIVSREAKKADYQVRNVNDSDDSQYAMLKKLEMPDEWHSVLIDYAEAKGIKFLSTGFDSESIDFLEALHMDFFKIPSGEITNKPYLMHIAKKGKPVVLSTGMATLQEVKEAIQVMEDAGLQRPQLTVLHCTTEYPTPMKDVNLKAMVTMEKGLGVKVGYSDHTLGIEIPIAAVALGAVVIEKHFTLDRSLPGPDHKASLEPVELKAMVRAIRNVELGLSGSGLKEPSESEFKNREIGRKSIFFKSDLSAGHVISLNDLIMIRPGDGLSPMLVDSIVGKKTKEDVAKMSKVEYNNIDDYGN